MTACDAERSVLVVDDEEPVRISVARILEQGHYRIVTVGDVFQAMERIREEDFGIVLADVRMPSGSGLDLIQNIKKLSPSTVAIVITGYATIDMVVHAMKIGAFDFITKPFSMERVLVAVKNGFECRRLLLENETLRKATRKAHSSQTLIGSSLAILDVQRVISKVANTDSTVLILGESGTGKELVARALHYQNESRSGPFVAVNCGAIPDHLLESELFGHEKGAFTGAVAARLGRFEMAHRGTLFLDEVGELSPALQVKLLRVLQEHAFERVGGTKTICVDVRVLAATNRDLEQAVEDRQFREDLFYRLNVIPVQIPPLRARTEDIPLLAQHFLDHVNSEKGTTVTGFAPEVMESFMSYRWPGNVRELQNLIERLVVLKKSGRIEMADLPARVWASKRMEPAAKDVVFPPEGINLPKLMDNLEERLIFQALALSSGVKSRAAELLGLNRTTLVEKLKKKSLT
jgi:two-component system response regulator AtoC